MFLITIAVNISGILTHNLMIYKSFIISRGKKYTSTSFNERKKCLRVPLFDGISGPDDQL